MAYVSNSWKRLKFSPSLYALVEHELVCVEARHLVREPQEVRLQLGGKLVAGTEVALLLLGLEAAEAIDLGEKRMI